MLLRSFRIPSGCLKYDASLVGLVHFGSWLVYQLELQLDDSTGSTVQSYSSPLCRRHLCQQHMCWLVSLLPPSLLGVMLISWQIAARIADLVKRGTLDLSAVRFFVLDEADRLVDQDGLATVEQLFQALPKSGTGTARLQVSFSCGNLRCC